MRILVVEDEEELASVIVELLEDERYAVDSTLTGDEADELMFVNAYDLVILDWTLPRRLGHRAAAPLARRRLRSSGLDAHRPA